MYKLTCLLLFLPFTLLAQQQSISELRANFEEPGVAYRGKPFWSWNGELEKDELIRQVHVMKEMGMGGFFMHSRTGLKTEYLGDKWFDLINACADEAEELGMEAWLYDEDRWPSGTAGGLVTKFPEYRAKLMTMHVFKPGKFVPQQQYDELFSCRLDSTNCYSVERVTVEEAKKKNKEFAILAFFVRERELSSFYNGYTDVDRMNRKATDYFIKITHDEYKKHCGDRIGTSIKGIFTDEPQRQSVFRKAVSLDKCFENEIYVPWTNNFEDEFQERMGYDILEKLPELFLQPEGKIVSPVKWNYAEVTQQLFLENWVKPIYDWCIDNNIQFTGHFLHENSLTAQTLMQGSLMRSYEYMHIPGVDVLRNTNQIYWIGKQCQSVTRQMGQKFMLSELYGVTGWEFDFAGHKYVGDWQALFGVNLRCHHLSWYTMEGQSKRDYPASILHQSTWYKEYDFVETYFSRLGYMLTQGQPDCDVLVINPVESVWSRLRLGWTDNWTPNSKDIIELEKAYEKMFEALQENQIDFDYGDEEMLMRHASIEKDENGNPVFIVGKASYKTVVLGKMTTLRSSTLSLLKEFQKAGGKIVLAGEAPKFLDAVPSKKLGKFFESVINIPFEKDVIAKTVRENTEVPVMAVDPNTGKHFKNIFCQVRRDGDRTILVAMNMSKDKSHENVLLKINARGRVSEWDCESGKIIQVDAKQNKDVLEITTSFNGPEEHVYTITPEFVSDAIPISNEKLVKTIPLSGPYQYTLDEPNLCVLDMGYVEIDGKKQDGIKEILKIDRFIREEFDLPYRGGSMVQPWFKKKFNETQEVKGKVKIHFPFYVNEIPDEDLTFCMESPDNFKVSVNGHHVNLEDKGWWVDVAIRKFTLPKEMLVRGENILVQEVDFTDEIEIESLYLFGNFGVRLEGNKKNLEALPAKVNSGDLTDQGFPFYSGKIRYKIPLLEDYSKLGKVKIEIPDYSAACIKIAPESKQPGFLAWQPNVLEVTEYLQEKNELIVEAVLTRRNAFGPLHHTPFTNISHPNNFISEGERFTNNYMLYPTGILENPKLLIFQ